MTKTITLPLEEYEELVNTEYKKKYEELLEDHQIAHCKRKYYESRLHMCMVLSRQRARELSNMENRTLWQRILNK